MCNVLDVTLFRENFGQSEERHGNEQITQIIRRRGDTVAKTSRPRGVYFRINRPWHRAHS